MLPLISFTIYTGTVFAEQQRNAPQTCKADEAVDDSAKRCCLATKDPRYQVKLEERNKPPVQRPDDRQDQRNGIHIITSINLFRTQLG